MSGTLTVHVGDLHVGSTVALMPPRVRLDDGGVHVASHEQVWYWECWKQFWDHTARLKAELGAYCLVVFGGDLRDGDHHRTTQLWAKSEDDQDVAVYRTLEVARPVGDGFVFIRGTPAHSGPASAADERYARTLARNGWPVLRNGERYSFWTWTRQIGRERFQVKHEPGTKSYVPHTQEAAATRQAFYTWLSYARRRVQPPTWCVWHHVHYDSAGQFCGTKCRFVPGWQLPTGYVVQKTHAPVFYPPGGLRVHVDEGGSREFPLMFEPDHAVAWK